MADIAIADFGTGNLHSVYNAFEALGNKRRIVTTRSAAEIRNASRLVLPGQGAIGTFMQELADDEARSAVEQALASKPVLGICLGLQAMYSISEEEGGIECLGVLSGRVRRFSRDWTDSGRKIKIPDMGWSEVLQRYGHPLWKNIADRSRFYFVHSYYADAQCASEIAATAIYGATFTCAATKENLFAVQFHPEKSRRHGLQLLENFTRWDGQA